MRSDSIRPRSLNHRFGPKYSTSTHGRLYAFSIRAESGSRGPKRCWRDRGPGIEFRAARRLRLGEHPGRLGGNAPPGSPPQSPPQCQSPPLTPRRVPLSVGAEQHYFHRKSDTSPCLYWASKEFCPTCTVLEPYIGLFRGSRFVLAIQGAALSYLTNVVIHNHLSVDVRPTDYQRYQADCGG